MGTIKCKACFKEKAEDLFPSYRQHITGKTVIRKTCKECFIEAERLRMKERYKKHREKMSVKASEYRRINRLKINSYYHETYWRDPAYSRERSRNYFKPHIDALSDRYVAQLLGGTPKTVPKNLIEAKRIQIQIQRLLKNGNQ